MAITHAWSSTAAVLNGGSVVLAIPASSIASGDVVVAFGGRPGRAVTGLGPNTGLGYTSIYTTGSVATGPNFWVGFKVMGATPDTSFVGLGSENASDGTAYGAYAFRGVSSVVNDAVFKLANGNSTNPNAPSIVTATDNAVVFIPAISQVNDAAIFSVLGYSNFKFATANDTLDVTIAGNWASIAVAGSTDPGAYQGWATASWIAATVALKPAAAPTVVTSFIGSITGTTAIGQGNVTDDGGTAILQRGFAWNTTGNPTTSDNFANTTGTTGVYQSSITGLSGLSSYFGRAFGINAQGSTYGTHQLFTTQSVAVGVADPYQSFVGGFYSVIPKPFRGIVGYTTIQSGPTLEDLAFTSVVNLTESPTYTWTRTAAGNSSASATKSLAASTNGYLQYEINSGTSWNAGIGFSSNAGWVTGDPFSYLFYLDGGTGTYKTYDATDGYVDTTIAAVTGDLVKIERSGSTFTAQYYRGGSWTTARTYTPTSSAQMYIYLQIYDVGGTQRVINPKGYNVS